MTGFFFSSWFLRRVVNLCSWLCLSLGATTRGSTVPQLLRKCYCKSSRCRRTAGLGPPWLEFPARVPHWSWAEPRSFFLPGSVVQMAVLVFIWNVELCLVVLEAELDSRGTGRNGQGSFSLVHLQRQGAGACKAKFMNLNDLLVFEKVSPL